MLRITAFPPRGSSSWGDSIPVERSKLCCSRLELYTEAALWRQSACQVLQEDPMRPLRDMISELVPGWDQQLPDLGQMCSKEEALQAASEYTGPSRFQDLVNRAYCGESVESIMATTARDLVALGYLGAEVLQWVQAQATYSLMVSWEHLPVTLMPPGARGERSAAIAGLVRRIGVRRVTTPRRVLEAWDTQHGRQYFLTKEERVETERMVPTEQVEKVAGRMIWDPWPFLLVHEMPALDDLLARIPGRVTLREMRPQSAGDGTELLVPRAWHQVTTLASKVVLKGTIPLRLLGGLPTAQRMAARRRQVQNTPFHSVWLELLDAMAPQFLYSGNPRFWVLSD